MMRDIRTSRGASALEPIDDGIDQVRGVSTATLIEALTGARTADGDLDP